MFRVPVPSEYYDDKTHLKFQLVDYHGHRIDVPRWEHPDVPMTGAYSPAYVRSKDVRAGGFQKLDGATKDYHTVLFGRTEEGFSVCLAAKTFPVLVLRMYGAIIGADFVKWLCDRHKFPTGIIKSKLTSMHDAGGFHPDVSNTSATPSLMSYPVLQLAFPSLDMLWRARAILSIPNRAYNESAAFCDRADKYLPGRKRLVVGVRTVEVEVVERMIPLIVLLLQESCITPSCLVQIAIADLHIIRTPDRMSHCDLEAKCVIPAFGINSPLMAAPNGELCNYPLVVHSFDIETMSDSGNFPNPTNLLDQIICIASTTRCGSRELKVVHGLHSYTNFPDEANVLCCKYDNEIQLLEGWRDAVVRLDDPDIMTGYNINTFDWSYMHARALLLSPNSRFFFFGRLTCVPCEFKRSNAKSKAKGTHAAAAYVIPGRINFDLLPYIRDCPSFKLDNYKLTTVSMHFLKDDKDDLEIATIFEYYRSGDPDKMQKIMQYCLKDTLLPLLLMDHLQVLAGMVEMSRVVSVFLADLAQYGEMFKVVSQLFIFARLENFYLSNLPDFVMLGINTYQGAKVLTEVKGFYQDCLVLDFASLYPSIMIARNLCYSTWVKPSDMQQYGHLPNVKYYDIATDIGTFRYQQSVVGLVPKLLQQLLHARSLVKHAMRSATGVHWKQLSSRQLALKFSANSVYGNMGTANHARYSCPPVAASTTSEGRTMINITQREVERKFAKEGASVIYGDTDSVFVTVNNTQGTPLARRQHLFTIGALMATQVTQLFPDAITLEFEKVYINFLLMSKKCYTGLKFESVSDEGTVDSKGFAVVRRDVFVIVRTVLLSIIDAVIKHRNTQGAIQLLVDAMERLLGGTIPYHDMSKSCLLAQSYKTPKLIQDRVAQKMRARKPGGGPRVGERISYVIVKCPKDTPNCEQGEDVEFAAQQTLPLDTLHYINALESPINKMFEVFPVAIKQRITDVFVHYKNLLFRSDSSLLDLRAVLQVDGPIGVVAPVATEVFQDASLIPRSAIVAHKPKKLPKSARPPGCASLAAYFPSSGTDATNPTPSSVVHRSSSVKNKKRVRGTGCADLSVYFKPTQPSPPSP
jgi:DNA polymerase elongation subunit (family B)